jgi:hypothetical protein
MRVFKALFSGNMRYQAPPMPVRGYDAVARDVPADAPWRVNPTGGTGHYAGTYARQTPFVMNTALVAILAPVNGAGTQNRSFGLAGHLIRPSALFVVTPDGL